MHWNNDAPANSQPLTFASLEPAAQAIVKSTSHRSVIAGPGAGKTELLAQRARYLLETGVSPAPRRILALTFKRDAATNLRERVQATTPTGVAARFSSFTYDAFGKNLLDRFRMAVPPALRPTADYGIDMDHRALENIVEEFLAQIPGRAAIAGLDFSDDPIPTRGTFLAHSVDGQLLLSEQRCPTTLAQFATNEWWGDSLHSVTRPSKLTFPMIVRLAELVLRENPLIAEALRASYSHVFMDEFQDTTKPQYDLVVTAFCGSSSIVTAVGDSKQRIMKWAGALDHVFERFEADFAAARCQLTSNYRSSPRLVAIQHTLARSIDGSSRPIESRIEARVGPAPCEIRESADVAAEAEDLAHLVRSELEEGLSARDVVLLVRQKPQDYETPITEAFARHALRVRNETAIQDLLSQRLTRAVIPYLRVGSVERSPGHWHRCLNTTGNIWRADPVHDGRLIARSIHNLRRKLAHGMRHIATSEHEVKQIVGMVVDHLGRPAIKQAYGEYQQGDYFERIEADLVRYLTRSCQASESWRVALDALEGVGTVPMMTIHKSKGLEFAVVIFVGLDDHGWWSFIKDPDEGRSTFFVAFSRAKQRVIFTYCQARGPRNRVSPLYALLQQAGVNTVTIT